jgi:threonine/homoserine/homoserine lactone efflux protein
VPRTPNPISEDAVNHYLVFLGIAAVVIVTPGQDTALTIRNVLRGGRRSGVFTALGVAMGQGVWSIAASAGVTALLIASKPAFVAIKLAGAAYLIVIGAQALRSALRHDGGRSRTSERGAARSITPHTALRQGLISNLGNPKMAVFFTSLLPQFAPAGRSSFLVLLLLGLVFCTLTCTWLTGYAFAVAIAGDLLRRPRVRRVLDGITGITLVGFGVRLAAEQQ